MTNEEIYRHALMRIASMSTEKPAYVDKDEESTVNDYAGGNMDDAYEIGLEVGYWEAAEAARAALARATK